MAGRSRSATRADASRQAGLSRSTVSFLPSGRPSVDLPEDTPDVDSYRSEREALAGAVELVQQCGRSARFTSGISAAVPTLTWWVMLNARSNGVRHDRRVTLPAAASV